MNWAPVDGEEVSDKGPTGVQVVVGNTAWVYSLCGGVLPLQASNLIVGSLEIDEIEAFVPRGDKDPSRVLLGWEDSTRVLSSCLKASTFLSTRFWFSRGSTLNPSMASLGRISLSISISSCSRSSPGSGPLEELKLDCTCGRVDNGSV